MITKEDIIKVTHEFFTKYGIRSVSLDDIARHLAVSKKTLYQYFKDKDEMVTESVKLHLHEEEKEFCRVTENSCDAIEQMVNMSVLMRQSIKDLNPTLMYDMQKFHKNAWEIWQSFKRDFIGNSIIQNIQWGMEEKFFRGDIDVETLAIMRMQQVEMSFDQDIFPKEKFDFREVQMELFDHFIHGIITEKGRGLFDKYKSKHKIKSGI